MPPRPSTCAMNDLLPDQPIAPAAPLPRRSRQARIAWGPNVVTVGMDETRFLPLVERARVIPGLIVTEIEASHAVNAQNPAQWNEATVRFLTEHAPTVPG